MNLPSSAFTSTPVGQRDIDNDVVTETRRLAPLRAAAVHEADLASFQMLGVWVGVVSSIAWIFGNSSEPFLLTLTGEHEAKCSGLSCPLREWLQSDSDAGYFTVKPRDSSAPDLDTQHSAWQQDGVGLTGFHAQDASHHNFYQTPVLPSAPFDFWLGHIDQPTTVSNVYQALSTPLDVGVHNQQRHNPKTTRDQVAWVLDIDLDAFMPARFSHRAMVLTNSCNPSGQSPPWSYGGQLEGCSQYLYRSLCHRWSSPAGENCTLWRHVSQLFHGGKTTRSTGVAQLDDADLHRAPSKAHDEPNGLSKECQRDVNRLRNRWIQLVEENPGLGAAGKRLSPPELLLWMQAYDHAAPTLAEGGSANELISMADLAHLPRFLSRLESLLRGLRGTHARLHPEKGAAAPAAVFGPPAAITIARSTDGFAPIETIPHIERMVVDMLDRLYGPTRRRSTVGSSESMTGSDKKTDRRATMFTHGGLQVLYTEETATLDDLHTMVQWLPALQ